MATRRFVEELMRELPAWERKGLVSHGSADELRRYYEPVLAAGRMPLHYLSVLLSVLSAALVGGGIILIISHNWDMFSPGIRLAIAYVPLFAAIALGFFTLSRREKSVAWNESSALLLGATAASGLAIVSQLYHLNGTTADFLLVWLLMLVLPVYLFKSAALATVYSIVLWVFFGNSWNDSALLLKLTLLFVLILPMLIRLSWPGGPRALVVLGRLFGAGGLLLLMSAGTAEVSGGGGGSIAKFCYAIFFALLCVGGGWLDAHERRDRFGVIAICGWIGILWMLYAAGYSWFWKEYSWNMRDFSESGSTFFCVLVVLYAACIWYAGVRCRNFSSLFPVFLPVFLLITQRCAQEEVGIILCNLLLAALGVALLVTGYRRRKLVYLNCGMGVLALQILLRFCSAEDILVYAFSFIALGLITGLVNLILARRFRQKGGASC